ncbi:MAG: hypothetical protein ACREE2_05325 [Stellaceae bacterium]
MAFAFDSLSFAKELQAADIPRTRPRPMPRRRGEFIMVELVTRHDLDTARRELQSAIDTTRRELEASIDNLGLRLTIRMGVMLAAGLTLLGAVLKLHS